LAGGKARSGTPSADPSESGWPVWAESAIAFPLEVRAITADFVHAISYVSSKRVRRPTPTLYAATL
jgi:hypothetical protein